MGTTASLPVRSSSRQAERAITVTPKFRETSYLMVATLSISIIT